MKNQNHKKAKAAYTEKDVDHAYRRIENIINKFDSMEKCLQHILLRAKRIGKPHKAAAYVYTLEMFNSDWASEVDAYFTENDKY